MERTGVVEAAELNQQQTVMGQLALELQSLTNSTAVEHMQNELALMADDFVRRCNFLALQLMNEMQFNDAFGWLTRAEKLAVGGQGVIFFDSHELLRRKALAAVHNNLGLFHFKRGEYATAEASLAQAVDEEDALGGSVADNKGTTLLNLAQTQMALHRMMPAEHTLHRAIQALEEQLEKCVVTVQIINTGLLAVRAYYLLAQCREYDNKFAAAADAAMSGLRLHVRFISGSSGAKRGLVGCGPNAQLATDLDALYHRCSEKERVFPKLLRPASAKPSAVRSKSTPFVVTSLTEPVQHKPAPLQDVAAQSSRPSRPSSTRPVSASVRHTQSQAASTLKGATPYQTPQLAANATGPSSSSSAVRLLVQQPTLRAEATNPLQEAMLPTTLVADEKQTNSMSVARQEADHKLENDAAIVSNARQSCSRRKPAPPSTKQVFRASATGLERVYGSLSEKHRVAFDKLCATRPATSQTTTASLFPATVPQIARVALLQHSTGSASSYQHQTVAAASHSPPAAGRRPLKTSSPPKSAAAPEAVNPSGMAPLRVTPQSSSLSGSGAIVPVSVRPVEQLTGSGHYSSEHDNLFVAEIGAACTIQNFWRGIGRRAETRRRAEIQRHREEVLRETIRREEEQRAMEHARRVIEENELRLQRERAADAMNAANTRREVTAHSLLLPSMLNSSDAVAGKPVSSEGGRNGEGATSSNSDIDGGSVPSALALLMVRQQIRDSQEKVSVTTRETLEKARQVRLEKRALKKKNASLVLQFVVGSLATRLVTARAIALRDELMLEYALRQRRKFAALTITRFLRECVAMAKQREVQRRIDEEKAAAYGSALVCLSQCSLAKWSSCVVARTAARRLASATLLLQRTVRASHARHLLQLVLVVRNKARRQQRLHAARVIQRFALRFLGRLRRLGQWAAIRTDNFSNKQSYAATRIQHAWRWHAVGRPREAQRKLRRAELVQSANMRMKHDQLIQELVEATCIIQRYFRGHLGRRQRHLREAARAKQAHGYILREWLQHAVGVLQRFCALVRAKREVRLRREMKNYILGALSKNEERVRRHLFPSEWNKYDVALEVLQRVGRGSLVRRAYRRYRILSVAAFEGRLSRHAELVHAALSAAAVMPEPHASLAAAAVTLEAVVVVPREASGNVDTRPANVETTNVGQATREAEHVVGSPTADRETKDHPSTASTGSSADEKDGDEARAAAPAAAVPHHRKYRKSTKRSRTEQPKKRTTATATPPQVSSPPLQPTLVASRELTAKKTIVQFMRTVLARRHYSSHREHTQDSIFRHEAAVYIQSTWRGYAVRRWCLAAKRAARDESVQKQLMTESASTIQATFRGHRARREKRNSPKCDRDDK